MHTGLLKDLEIREAPLPAVFLKNRDRIRGSELPILCIPGIKDLGRLNNTVHSTILVIATV